MSGTTRYFRWMGYHDGLNGRGTTYPHVEEYMVSFREGRRRLIRNKVKKIRAQHLWARSVSEEK